MDLKQNNNRRMISLIAPLAIGFSLCACGSDNVAGGGPSGTEAGNAITAQILIANAPAANARVKLVEHNSLDGQGYTATANDSGYVTIENVAIGNYTMEASLDESALALQLPVDVKDTVSNVALGQQNLQKSVFIGGSIADFIDDTTESIKSHIINARDKIEIDDLEDVRSDFFEGVDNTAMFWKVPSINTQANRSRIRKRNTSHR